MDSEEASKEMAVEKGASSTKVKEKKTEMVSKV